MCKPTANYPVIFLCCSLTDVLLDIAILAIPAMFIKNLQVSHSQKVGLISIFGLGTL